TALSQRVVDGMDIPVNFMVSGKYYNVCKQVAMLNHVVSIIPIMASTKKLAALPPNLQKLVREEAKAAQAQWRDQTAQQLRDDVDALRKNGVTVNEHIQIAPFRKAVTPVYAAYQGKFGDIVDRIGRAG